MGRRFAHRCIAALEDAGFTFKEMLSWLHAQRLSIILVLDHFCGSDSTLVAAQSLKSNDIGIEIDTTYVQITRERLQESVPQNLLI